MHKLLKDRIKKILSTNPDSVIFYHEHNEWSIYSSASSEQGAKSRKISDIELLGGNDYHNVKEYAPELVVALAELLGIQVRSNDRSR